MSYLSTVSQNSFHIHPSFHVHSTLCPFLKNPLWTIFVSQVFFDAWFSTQENSAYHSYTLRENCLSLSYNQHLPITSMLGWCCLPSSLPFGEAWASTGFTHDIPPVVSPLWIQSCNVQETISLVHHHLSLIIHQDPCPLGGGNTMYMFHLELSILQNLILYTLFSWESLCWSPCTVTRRESGEALLCRHTKVIRSQVNTMSISRNIGRLPLKPVTCILVISLIYKGWAISPVQASDFSSRRFFAQ